MTTYLDTSNAIPAVGNVTKATLRTAFVKRVAYCLADSEDLRTLTVVDPNDGTVPLYIIQVGRSFEYDSTDSTTAHDGTSCLVSADGKRFKTVTFSYPHSVLSRTLTAPPGSPSVGDRYIVATAATGAWSGHDGAIAVYTERGWQFVTAPEGKQIYVEAETAYYHLDEYGAWVAGLGSIVLGAGTVAPSSLTGGGKRVKWFPENQTTNTPPAVTNGTEYIIGPSPTGAWSGDAGKIAHGEGGSWIIYTPAAGWTAYDKSLGVDYEFNGSAWIAQSGAIIGSGTTPLTTTGSTTTGGSTYYTFSATSAPTTSNTYREDSVTLSYKAKKSGARLRFTYEFENTDNTSPTCALFIDATSNSIAWSSTNIGNNVINSEMTSADASNHVYKVRLLVATPPTPASAPTRRRLSVLEFA